MCKYTTKIGHDQIKLNFFDFFCRKILSIQKKAVPLHPLSKKNLSP